MWLPMRYMLLRLLVNMNVCCGLSFVVVREMSRAYSFACRMFGKPKSLLAMWRSFFGMYTPEPVKLPMQGLFDGMNKPFV